MLGVWVVIEQGRVWEEVAEEGLREAAKGVMAGSNASRGAATDWVSVIQNSF